MYLHSIALSELDFHFEIIHETPRYILRRNPVRTREIEDNRNRKIEKIRNFVNDRNIYLSEHRKAEGIWFYVHWDQRSGIDHINR